MKVAIYLNNDERFFCHKWIDYCEHNHISYKLVNVYDSNIVEQVDDCDAVMWHISQSDYRDLLFAKQLIYSFQLSGKKVFPDFNTLWHFDDKIGQKYLLESIGAPFVPSYVFYNKKEAEEWIEGTTFPKVFKLRNGGGAKNVRLVESKRQALALSRKAFGKGFGHFNRWNYLKEKIRIYKAGKGDVHEIVKGLVQMFLPITNSHLINRQRGYVYFQDFIPDNAYDIRLIVIGGTRAYGMKRKVREGDFRASGSSDFIYDTLPQSILEIGFNVAQRLRLQSVAFDFIFNVDKPLIIEMSCLFGTKGSGKCTGYWDLHFNWHEGAFNPMWWQIENLLKG